jgi:hypothetical protein
MSLLTIMVAVRPLYQPPEGELKLTRIDNKHVIISSTAPHEGDHTMQVHTYLYTPRLTLLLGQLVGIPFSTPSIILHCPFRHLLISSSFPTWNHLPRDPL